MKNNNFSIKTSVLLCALTLGTALTGYTDELPEATLAVDPAAEEQQGATNEAQMTEITYDIQEILLAGQLNLLSETTRADLLAKLAQQRSVRSEFTAEALSDLLQDTQAWMEQKFPNLYVLSIPKQALVDGRLYILVEPRLAEGEVVSAEGFDADNIRASLPSLVVGKTLPSDSDWMDKRELQMANENPLKVTTLDYIVAPDAGVRTKIQAKAPKGSTQFNVGYNSFGNDATGRDMLMLGAINANLTGKDDVLSVVGMSSLNPLFDTNMVNIKYTLPNYERKRSDTFSIMHAYGSMNFPFLSFGKIAAAGTYDELNYSQSHYLGDWNMLGLKGVKLSFGASYIQNKAHTKISSLTLSEYDIEVLPLTASLEGFWEPSLQSKIYGQLQFSGSKTGLLNRSGVDDWQAARADSGNYTFTRLYLDGKTVFDNQASLSAKFIGQYTDDHLLPVFQMNTLNNYNGVRGFVNATAAGDKVALLRTELESANLLSDSLIKAYTFYDVGHKRGGNDDRNLTSSSTGLGLRYKTDDESFRVDMYAAYKLKGSERDLEIDNSDKKDRVSYWLTSSYSF